jgi:hypothetical protein
MEEGAAVAARARTASLAALAKSPWCGIGRRRSWSSKKPLSGLDRPDERPSLPHFLHIRSAILKTSQPTPPEKHDRDTAFSFCFLHDAYDLSRQMASNELLR